MDGVDPTVLLVVCAAVLVAAAMWFQRQARYTNLIKKYQNEEVVRLIISKAVCQGMTEEQLLDSLGRPAEIGKKVYKSKSVETYKYGKRGRNRYSMRVTVENGIVVGWERR